MIQDTTDAADSQQGAHVAPGATPAKKGASRKKSPPKAKRRQGCQSQDRRTKKEAKAARPRKDAAEASSNKKAEVIAMMKRAKGATLAEKTTGWQPHTVRGFVSTRGARAARR
jgi:hypothetical protein